MGVRESLTAHDPAQIITLLDINGSRYCDLAQPLSFGGAIWSPLDFVATQQSDGYSSLEIKVSASRHVAAVGPCRVMRVAGTDVLYDAAGLDVISIDSGPGLCEIVMGYLAATTPSTRSYSVGFYHGLRRFADPELPAQQVYGEESSQTATWYPGKNIRNAIDRYADFRARGGVQSIRKAALQPLRTANALLGRFVARLNAGRTVADPGSPYTPSRSLANQPFPDRAIPERFGRSVFAPDVAHPAYCDGSGTTVTRRTVMCLGIGEYVVHRIWVGGTLAWINGASNGAVDGLTAQKLAPGEQMTLDYVSLNSGPPLDAGWQPLDGQDGYAVDASDYSVTWTSSTGQPTPPQDGRYLHRDNNTLTLPTGVALATTGSRTSMLGKLPATGTASALMYVANIPPAYTSIPFDAVQITARRGASGQNISLFVGTVDGSPKVSDLALKAISMSGTNYAALTASVAGSGLQMLAVGKSVQSNSTAVFAADISIRPTFRPPVGHPDASHLLVAYTANAENLSLPIIVEATRILRGTPDDGIGACAYAVAVMAYGDASVDAASFLAVPGSCGGADYTGSAPWDTIRALLETANARPVWRAGKLYAAINEPAAPVMLITPRSMAQATITRSNRTPQTDGVSVQYVEATTGEPSSALFSPPGALGEAINAINLPYCRDASTADNMARAYYLASIRQGGVASIELADEGMALAPLDRVLIGAPDYGEAIAWGVLMPGDSWTTAAPADASPCVAYVRNADGSPFGPVAAMIGTDGKIYGAAATPSVTLPTHGAEWAAWDREPYRWAVADIRQASSGRWAVDLVEDVA